MEIAGKLRVSQNKLTTWREDTGAGAAYVEPLNNVGDAELVELLGEYVLENSARGMVTTDAFLAKFDELISVKQSKQTKDAQGLSLIKSSSAFDEQRTYDQLRLTGWSEEKISHFSPTTPTKGR